MICPCGKEVGFGRNPSLYCSEKCHDLYGNARRWTKDMTPESKADTAIKIGLKWVQNKSREQLIDWYKRTG